MIALLLGCGLLERPAPPEVRALLALPPGARVDEDGCVGAPRTPGFTCVVLADHPGGAMEADAAWAVDFLAGWEEVAWDRVPGRIQRAWRNGSEHASLAVHELPGGTRWSWSYAWGEFPAPIDPDPLAAPADPAATWPEEVADVPRPADARLHHVEPEPGTRVVFLTGSPPFVVVEEVLRWPGAEERLVGRTGQRVFAAVRRGDREHALSCAPAGGETVCTLAPGPAR